MDKAIKMKIGVAALDILLSKGLPAMVKLVTTLNNKSKITNADIDMLIDDLDAEDYFDSDVKTRT